MSRAWVFLTETNGDLAETGARSRSSFIGSGGRLTWNCTTCKSQINDPWPANQKERERRSVAEPCRTCKASLRGCERANSRRADVFANWIITPAGHTPDGR